MRTRIMHHALAAALLLAGAAAAQPVFESHGDLGVTPKTGAFEYDAAHAEYRVTGGGANIWGSPGATIVTILIVWTAFASVYTGLLGASRLPFNAARDGVFFRQIGRTS